MAIIVQGMAEVDEDRRPPPPVCSRSCDIWDNCRDAFLPVERASSAHANASEINTFTPKTNMPSNTISPSATTDCIVEPLRDWATSIGVILRYLMWELPQGAYIWFRRSNRVVNAKISTRTDEPEKDHLYVRCNTPSNAEWFGEGVLDQGCPRNIHGLRRARGQGYEPGSFIWGRNWKIRRYFVVLMSLTSNNDIFLVSRNC